MSRCDKLRKMIEDNEAVLIKSYPNIFYYSNFTSEDAELIITSDRQILFTDSRYTIQAHNEAGDFEIIDIGKKDETITSLGKEILCIEEDFITVKQFSALQKYKMKLKPFSQQIKKPRRTKDKEEIQRLYNAEQLGCAAFSHILDFIKVGKTEREVALELEFFMKKQGASALSFDTICASGVRSAMPHGTASEKIICDGDFVTLDFGCVLDGYCSDMTRTVIMTKATDRQKEVYNTVLEAQLAGVRKLGVGVKCADCDMASRKIITDKGYGKNFGHATGHSVGVEIHEMPVLAPKSPDILENGNAVTIEPGIYIEDFGGVRIEDLLVVTDEKVINLATSPKELIVL